MTLLRDSAEVDFSDWVRPHWADMQLLARRLCGNDAAEDAVQEALAAAWRKREQFDPDRGSPRSWLLAVVADQAYKQNRRRRPTIELADENLLMAPAGLPDVALDLTRVLRRLPQRQQLAVTLFYYLDVSVADTAQVMGCTTSTVKTTLLHARERLRTLLGEGYR